jgi:cytoskeletal protein CcmA (bactofilin family)
MFGRRNPNSPSDMPPPASSTPETDIDLDLLPDLPPFPPPARREPEAEPPPTDPVWHASAVPGPTPAAREKPGHATAEPAANEKATPTPAESAPTIPAESAAPTQAAPVPMAHPSITLPPRPTAPTASDKPAPARLKPSSESVIGPDDFFDGRYRSERGVRIQGNARGSIESRQYIFVEGGADVEADLSAEEITVAGNFNGKIECRRKLEVTSTGKVQGQVTTALLVVHEGGLIDGELHMRPDEQAPAA